MGMGEGPRFEKTTESVADRQQQQCSSVGEESGEVSGDTRRRAPWMMLLNIASWLVVGLLQLKEEEDANTRQPPVPFRPPW